MASKERGDEKPVLYSRERAQRAKRFSLDYKPAIIEGIHDLIENHQRFVGQERFLLKHIDPNKISSKIREIYQNIKTRLRGKAIPEDEIRQYILDGLSKYAAAGALFDQDGQGVILNSLEEKVKKGFFGRFFGRETPRDYLDNIIGAYQDVSYIIENGDSSPDMLKLGEAARTIKEMGYYNTMIASLNSRGLMDKSTYNLLKRSIREAVEKYHKASYSFLKKKIREKAEKDLSQSGSIEEYIAPQKAAAIIFGLLGLAFLIFSRFSLTGNAISSPEGTYSMTGILSILISAVLFFMSLKTKTKRI
jgi:hypothetical protein